MDTWELVARERIRDALARYSWSGDSYRLDELAAAFHPDGVLEVRGREPAQGRAGIVAFLSGLSDDAGSSDAGRPVLTDEERRAARLAAADAGGPRRIVRHLLTNTRFDELTPEQARVTSYFTVITELGLDHHGRYRDVLEPAGDEWLIRHRFVSTDWADPASTMAPPSSLG